MKNILKILSALILFLSFNKENLAQFSNLKTFGSMQPIFLFERNDLNSKDPLQKHVADTIVNSFILQQLDVFFQNSFSDKLSMFADIETKINLNSEKNWGAISIQEAWINYSFNDLLNIKFGSLYPEFNHLNSIRNRLNLMPYIFRPMVYELTMAKYVPQEDYIPESAFLEFYGVKPIQSFNFEYAIYMGNSEASYYSKEPPDNSIITLNYMDGIDSKNFKTKLYGLKVGINKADESFKLGFSLTHDYNNLNDSSLSTRPLNVKTDYDSIPITFKTLKFPKMGDVPRVRIGLDFEFSYMNFKLESEYIKVLYYNINYDSVALDERPSTKLGGEFYYTTLIYNYDENFYLFASYNKINDEFQKSDSKYFSLGGGYKIQNNVTFKFNYLYSKSITKSYAMIGFAGLPPVKVLATGEVLLQGITCGVSVNF